MSRVVVIDNQWKEAEPLLRALWANGVSAVYSNGTPPERESQRLSGVRLIFLDLELENSTSGIHQALNTTIGLLTQIVDLRQPGIGVVYWTKHPENVQKDFKKLLDERVQYFRPVFILPQEKLKYLGNAPSAVQELQSEITTALETNKAHGYLCAWEGAVLEGAISTTAALCPPGENDAECMKSLAALASGAGGSSNSSEEGTVLALCEAMHELLSDAIPPKGFFDRVKSFGADLRPRMDRAREKLSEAARHRLNRLLLLDPDSSEMVAASPGAIVLDSSLPALSEQRGTSSEGVKNEFLSLVKMQRAKLKEKKEQEKWDAEATSAAAGAVPMFVNVSPPCDVANSKCPQARFLAGLLVPVPSTKLQFLRLELLPEIRQFGRELPLFTLHGTSGIRDGAYWMVLNCRHLFTAPSTSLGEVKATFALRSTVLSDILAWFAAHAARPGIISV